MKKLPRTVVILGIISFFTDIAGEMIYPLLPLFLSSVLGAGAVALGAIEGIAESTTSLLKVLAGIWTDRTKKRKPFLVFGYTLAGLVKPLIAFANSWIFVLFVRFADRIGKGVRTSPRDALIADVSPINQRGRAYGFHRAMDHAGAIAGPLIASALLLIPFMDLRKIFLLAGIPAAIAIFITIFGIREIKSPVSASDIKPQTLLREWKGLGADFKIFIIAVFIFSLGNSADAFLILKLSEAGVSAPSISLLWAALHVVKMSSTYWGGRLSDKTGRKAMILVGWLIYALCYLALGTLQSPVLIVVAFLFYGLQFGFTEPSERAWVADLAPAHLKGSAFGYYHFAVGIAALPASLIFGFVWQKWGSFFAFTLGALLAACASIVLLLVSQNKPKARLSSIMTSSSD